jgi:hypothetical protein
MLKDNLVQVFVAKIYPTLTISLFQDWCLIYQMTLSKQHYIFNNISFTKKLKNRIIAKWFAIVQQGPF